MPRLRPENVSDVRWDSRESAVSPAPAVHLVFLHHRAILVPQDVTALRDRLENRAIQASQVQNLIEKYNYSVMLRSTGTSGNSRQQRSRRDQRRFRSPWQSGSTRSSGTARVGRTTGIPRRTGGCWPSGNTGRIRFARIIGGLGRRAWSGKDSRCRKS